MIAKTAKQRAQKRYNQNGKARRFAEILKQPSGSESLPKLERDVQADIVRYLRLRGYYVRITSKDIQGRAQESGLPHLLAFKDNTLLMVECKRPGGKMRPSQQEFISDIQPHIGRNIRYILADNVESLVEFEESGQ